jgi:hypothetical protein
VWAYLACRVRAGAVSRQVLEQALRSECRDLLLVVDGATVLDLLMTHTFGEGIGARWRWWWQQVQVPQSGMACMLDGMLLWLFTGAGFQFCPLCAVSACFTLCATRNRQQTSETLWPAAVPLPSRHHWALCALCVFHPGHGVGGAAALCPGGVGW